ncbi:MAG: hypothetical protein K0Q95_2782 [Bacteroidota bacterium]|jgi:hypothetical protein|nr:hypothetical protein [Bacteroidota bacterium]
MKKLILYILLFAPVLDVCSQADEILYKEFKNVFDVTPLNINSQVSEMSPFMAGKNLYFARNRKPQPALNYNNPESSEPMYDIYTASRIDSINFSTPAVSHKFSSLFNDGPLSFTEDETEALITCNEKSYDFILRSHEKAKQLKIYYSSNLNGKWSVPQIHPVCSEEGSFCHAVYCNNKNAMVFASDMPGGYGGMDLYITELKNGEWQKPRNLGKKINSTANEIFPFINKTGNLYFSSDRKNGMGGLDIYSIILKDTSSTSALLLESPVNSKADDFGIWTNDDGSSGYLSSDRLASKDDNIFYFYKIIPAFKNKVISKSKFCYTFFEESSLSQADTAGLTYEWDFGNGIKKRGLEVKQCFDKPGTYPVSLNVIDKSSGQLFYNDLNYDFVVEQPRQIYIASVDTVEIGNPIELDGSSSVIDGYTIKKYYWTFNDGWFSLGSKARHEYFTTGYHTVILGVVAESDSTCKEDTFYTVRKIYVKGLVKETGYNNGKNNWIEPSFESDAQHEIILDSQNSSDTGK